MLRTPVAAEVNRPGSEPYLQALPPGIHHQIQPKAGAERRTRGRILLSDPTLGLLPGTPGMRVVQTGAWILADEAPLEPALEEFLAAGAPPVYVGFGSMPAAQEAGRTIVEAVRSVGRRVVLSRGWAELSLLDGADDAIAIGDVNQQALFPRIAAVVHHGGSGDHDDRRSGRRTAGDRPDVLRSAVLGFPGSRR